MEFDFEHITISPHHSNVNGKVEAAVKVAKNLLTRRKADGKNPLLALIDQCNPSSIPKWAPVGPVRGPFGAQLCPTGAHMECCLGTHHVRALTLHQHSHSLTAGQKHCYQLQQSCSHHEVKSTRSMTLRKYCKGPASPNKATTKLLKTWNHRMRVTQ